MTNDKRLLSRKQYDLLVRHCPRYMQGAYASLNKKWHLGGIWAYGHPKQIAELDEQLTFAENCR